MTQQATEPITAGFDAETTAEEVVAGLDLGQVRAVVTGASAGIGVETARVLASRGAEVTLAVRDVGAGERVAAELASGLGADAGRLRVVRLDLADLGSVAEFVAGWSGPLTTLVNNAAVMALPERRLTAAGVELHLATNHLGHHALAVGLHDALAATGGARVVALTSSAHQYCPVLFDDPAFHFVRYDPFLGYGQSKTANALFAVGADRRWAGDGIRVNAVMPGGISTNLTRHVDPEVIAAARRAAGAPEQMKTIAQGAATSVLCAVSPLLDGVGGRYFEDCAEAPRLTDRTEADGRHGVAPYALDPDNAERLWELSEAWRATGSRS